MKAIIITADNVISVVDVKENGEPLYQLVRNTVGGYMENVYPRALPNGYVMVVDEEGKLKHKPVNQLGSILYMNAADVIVGDVIILKMGVHLGESDIVGIPDNKALSIKNYIDTLAKIWLR